LNKIMAITKIKNPYFEYNNPNNTDKEPAWIKEHTKRFENFKDTNVAAEVPVWNDEPFDPPQKWGTLAGDIGELIQLIEEAAGVLRANVPSDMDEFVTIQQREFWLDIKPRGAREQSRQGLWVTEKTLPHVMRVLCSMRLLKPQIERQTSHEEATELYKDALTAFGYTFEPGRYGKFADATSVSGQSVLEPQYTTAEPKKRKKSIGYQLVGYLFFGDQQKLNDSHQRYVDYILDKLRDLKEPKISDKTNPEPQKQHIQAYNLYYGSGWNQQKVADHMTQVLHKPINQGTISRWIQKVKKWRESQGLPVEKTEKPEITANTDILEMGARTDGKRTGDPRHGKINRHN